MGISNAVLAGAVARVIGTSIEFVDLRAIPQRAPIQVAVFAPPNVAAEGTVDANKAFEFISAKEVGDEMGYDSPAYRVARMLRPEFGGGASTIRTVVFPIIPAGGAAATDVLAINLAGGTPTKNTTHILNVNGRRLPFSVFAVDTPTTLADRIKETLDAAITVNPVTSVVEAPVVNDIDITLTAGWNGESGNGISIIVEADDPAGVVYVNPVFAGGVGVFDVTTALANFGATWYNLAINACDSDELVLDQFENFNGSPETKLGRWEPTTMRPFVALYGTLDSDKDTVTTVPDTRKLDLSNIKCPAPGSPGFDFESAGAYALQMILTASANPPKAYSGLPLLDMPVPDDPSAVGDFALNVGRDFIEKRGVSTATLKGDQYVIEDVNTHYHPDGIDPTASPYFRAVHVFGRSFNVIFQYNFKVETILMNKVLVDDVRQTTNPESIDPAKWGSVVRDFIDDLETQGITTDAAGSRETVQVGIGELNPEKVETSFQLTYSNNVKQGDSTIRFGFNFGQGR